MRFASESLSCEEAAHSGSPGLDEAVSKKGSKSSTLTFEDSDSFYQVDNRPAQPAYGPYMRAMARDAARFEVRDMWLTACVFT